MAMFTQHLIVGEEFYIDPKNGLDKVIKCTLIQQHPNSKQLYVFQSANGKQLYIVHQNDIYKMRPYATRGQLIRRIKQNGKFQIVNDLDDLTQHIKTISYTAGEQGYMIRKLLEDNDHIIRKERGIDLEESD